MAPKTYDVPMSLSPSRVSSFTTCPMQFRFSSIEKLPEPPGVATTRGTIVHRALELLFVRPAAERTPESLQADLAVALDEYRTHPDYVGLRLDEQDPFRFGIRRFAMARASASVNRISLRSLSIKP